MKLFGAIVLSLGLTLSIRAEDKVATRPAQDASSTTKQNDSVGNIPIEIEKAIQMPYGKERLEVIKAASLEWCKKEPTKALAWAIQLQPSFKWESYWVVGKCAANHGKLTADWCLKNKGNLQNYQRQYAALHQAIHFWGTVDPAAASEWCMQAPEEVRHLSFASMGSGWCVKDPVAATKWALGLPSQADRHSAIFGIVEEWCGSDLTATTTWIKTLKNVTEVKVAAKAVVGQLGWDKAMGVKYVFDGPVAVKNSPGTVKEWLNQLKLSDADKADILNSPYYDQRTVGKVEWPRPMGNYGYAGKMPPEVEKALQTAKEMPAGKERDGITNPAIWEWTKKDPTAVLAWVVKLPPEFKSVYFYTIGRCGENGGKIALDWCLENKEYFPLHYGIHTLAEYVAPSPAVAWCMQAPEEVHHLAFGSTAMGWAYRDPVGAATWFSELKAPLDARRSVAYGIAFGWVHSYPKDALAATTWVAGIKSKEERLSAIYGMSAMWIRHNMSPATAWIKTMGDKEELRAALSGAFKTIQMGIADKVSGGGFYDAAYAKEWLDQFPLSDLDKTYIIHTADEDLAIHGSKTGKIVWPK